MNPDHDHLEVLSRQECLRLLRRVDVGRVGLSLNALPVILPVRFVLVGDDIIFSSPTAIIHAALCGNIVCFEADDAEGADSHGWSVLVTGHARGVQCSEDVKTPAEQAGLGGRLVRLSGDVIGGHRGPLGGRARGGA